MTLGLLVFIVVASLAIVAVAVAVDVGSDQISKKKAERAARKEKEKQINDWALRMLTIAGLHKNAYAVYRREQGSHRRVRIG